MYARFMALSTLLIKELTTEESGATLSLPIVGREEMRSRDEVEELVHDTKQEAYDQKRRLALEELKRQYRNELTYGEIGEAIAEFGSDRIAETIRLDDDAFHSLCVNAVDEWIDRQAEQEIQRRERKGEFV
jgi:hypothetical protein